jgi:hypothetical protein
VYAGDRGEDLLAPLAEKTVDFMQSWMHLASWRPVYESSGAPWLIKPTSRSRQ